MCYLKTGGGLIEAWFIFIWSKRRHYLNKGGAKGGVVFIWEELTKASLIKEWAMEALFRVGRSYLRWYY